MTPGEVIAWVVVVIIAVIAIGLDLKGEHWRKRADDWMTRAVRAEGGPSTTRDVCTLREYREQRALTSINHTLRHSVEASCDSEAATEIMQLCVGPMEVEGGE